MLASINRKSVVFDRSLRLVLILCLLSFTSVTVHGAGNFDQVQILKGDMVKIDTKALTKVSITDPEIADISGASAEGITVIGKETGQTVLFIWDGDVKTTTIVQVVPENTAYLKSRAESLLFSANIHEVIVSESPYEGRIVLTGELTAEKRNIMEKALEPLFGKYLNLVGDAVSEDMIQIDMQVTDLSTTLTKELGVDWFSGTQSGDGATGKVTGTIGDGLNPMAVEVPPDQAGTFNDMFKIGNFYRSTDSALIAKINALIIEGRARVLSKPRLVVMSGKQATFLVGGEIPIRTTTTNASGGSTQENVEYKEYGVSLMMTPTIRNDKVDLLMNVEISDIDAANSSGDDVAFTTRTAQTQLFLDDRQTIVLAGLIRKQDGVTVRKVPLLGSIPVLGMLFRSKKTPANVGDSELVISLTPTIIASANKNKGARAFQAKKGGSANFERDLSSSYVSVSQALAPYARQVQEKISAFIVFPYEARRNGWEGVVKLALIIKRDGSLRDAFIQESSGYEIFDLDALNTARGLSPYFPIPDDIRSDEVSVTIPIAYRFDSVNQKVQ
jgi:pilus assembly protein CpaC